VCLTQYQQDKEDDVKIGMHSPALFLGQNTIPVCTATALLFLGLVSYGGFLNGHGLPFFLGVAVAGTLLLRGLMETDIDSPEDCRRMFLGTPRVGQSILIGLIADAVYKRLSAGLPL
jgi:4-hydroxybenzoate polyprenyltransferase